MTKRKSERVVMMELSQDDIVDLHASVRSRSASLAKEAKTLRGLGCHREADALEAKVNDLNTRLATQLAAEMDDKSHLADDSKGEEKKPDEGEKK